METRMAPHVQTLFNHGSPSKIHIYVYHGRTIRLPWVFIRIHEHFMTTKHNPSYDTIIISFNNPT